jgi:adenylylsulfate kinase
MNAPRHLVWQHSQIDRSQRERLNGHRSAVLWFTGLSGSGKTTLAHAVEAALYGRGVRSYVLDGDNIRHGLCADLGFNAEDRSENIRRIGEVASLFADAGLLVLTAFISPFAADRERVRQLIGAERFIEIYCSCPLEQCEQRDSKGLYGKARRGELAEFTGIGSPYEAPLFPQLTIDTSQEELAQSVVRILYLLQARGFISTS